MLRLVSAVFFLFVVFTLVAFGGDRSDREVVVPAKPVKTIRIAPNGDTIAERWVDIVPAAAAAEAKPAAPAPAADDQTGMLIVAGGVAAIAILATLYVLGVGRPTHAPRLEHQDTPQPRPTWLLADQHESKEIELTTSFEEQLREIVIARQGHAPPKAIPFDPYA